jgi:eukaryotic-like serine/threonine-protein kinase
MKSFFRLVFLALVLLVVAMVSALTAMRFAIHGRIVSVPDLVGKTPAEARRITDELGLQVEVERQYYSPSVPEGHILSQLPTAGTGVRRGWQIRVAESLGPQRVAIPNVVGQTQRAAVMNIERRGLDLGGGAQIWMPGSPEDQVLSQSPPPNASGVSAPKISLLVAAASPPQALVMPRFVGQPIGSVTQELQTAGLKVGTIAVAPPATDGSSPLPNAAPSASQRWSPASVVVSQTPAAGAKVVLGTAVDFAVR